MFPLGKEQESIYSQADISKSNKSAAILLITIFNWSGFLMVEKSKGMK
jgi:hypothetical protein